jgi:hypothetical protein
MLDADIIVVGSGAAGAQAAKKAVALGFSVLTLDVGVAKHAVAQRVPDAPFSRLRREDGSQRAYFIGDLDARDISDPKGGAHLTPPRAHVTERAAELAPFSSATFSPVTSLACGGLASAWGAGCETFTAAECERAGLDPVAMRSAYQEVADDVGISGSLDDDIAANMADFGSLQPPQPLDDNAAALFARYGHRRGALRARGFALGRPPIAMLSRPLHIDGYRRDANPLFDMDMYSDGSRSVYRAWMTIEQLRAGRSYVYRDGMLVRSFEERDGVVTVHCDDLTTGGLASFTARRVILGAGALNTVRIVLRSLGAFERRVPLLCNRYRYLPSLNLAMLGRRARDERHSLAQLAATLNLPGEDAPDQSFIGFYSYRSLLTYRLVQQMPFPTALGLLATRLMLSSLTILGIHLPESPSPAKWLALERTDASGGDVMRAEYVPSADEERDLARRLRALRGVMSELALLPLGVVDPGEGASIHYAGGLPFANEARELATHPAGNLYAAPAVYIADSASWNFLPGKGPTLSIMAHARNVTAAATRTLLLSA